MRRRRSKKGENGTHFASLHKDAVLYARVSSKEQEKEGFSIDAQQKLLHEYALEQNINIVQEYVDVESAKQAGRTRFGEMVSFLNKHKECRIILVEKTDRLYRNIRDWVTIDDLDREIHFVKENMIFSSESRSSEKFIHGIKVLMAKNYIDNLSEETKKGQQEKAEQGIYPSYAPIGYKNVGSNGKRLIEPDQECADLVRRVYELFSTGEYSLSSLTQKMNQEGLNGKRKGNKILKSQTHRLLRNPLYCGEFEWKGKLYNGIHEPLVSKRLWEQVQSILDKRSCSPEYPSNRHFAFTGLFSCGHCGCAITAELKKGKYVYYHCTGGKGKCDEPYIREEKLCELLEEQIKQLNVESRVAEMLRVALRSSHHDEQRYHNEQISQLNTRYNRLQERIDKMYIDKLDGLIPEKEFLERNREWRNEQQALLDRKKLLQDANQNYVDLGSRIIELAEKSYHLFSGQPPFKKAKLLKILLSNCSYREGKLLPEWRKPFDLLVSINSSVEGGEGEKGLKNLQYINWLQR